MSSNKFHQKPLQRITSKSPSIFKSYSFKNYQRQNFSLPDTIIYHITKSISSPTAYQKLISTCKYFYEKNSILTVHCLNYGRGDPFGPSENVWRVCQYIGGKSCDARSGYRCRETVPNRWKIIDLNFISQKIWVTNCLHYFKWDALPWVIPSNIQLSIISFSISNQTISLEQLIIIGSSLKSCNFSNVSVKDKNGNKASLAKIIENLPRLEIFTFYRKNSSHITTTIVKELLNTPKFSTLKRLNLCNITDGFDIEEFYKFLKKNKTMDIHLFFNFNLPESYCKKRRIVIGKIMRRYENYSIWPPKFCIPATENGRAKRIRLNVAHEKYAEKNHKKFLSSLSCFCYPCFGP